MPGTLDLAGLAAAAQRAALAGGRIVLEGAGEVAAERKGAGDYVTEVDRASERTIAVMLTEATPEVPVVGEEAGGDPGDRWWVVDPLDGTTNFLRRFPAVAVSVALVELGRPVVGAVHGPFLGQTYVGARGFGAYAVHDGAGRERLSVSTRPAEDAVVGTGFPFRRKDLLPRYLGVMEPALERFEDLRRPGAAALDLAWVAAGVFEGFFELALNAWDVAAGALLVEEAGGVVTDWEGSDGFLSGDILAGSPAVHAELLALARRDR
ncbi:MAG TPA: inositol monophosphatase family protein [Actinomycetota bacterium]